MRCKNYKISGINFNKAVRSQDLFRFLQIREYFIEEIQAVQISKPVNAVVDTVVETYSSIKYRVTSQDSLRDCKTSSTLYIKTKMGEGD